MTSQKTAATTPPAATPPATTARQYRWCRLNPGEGLIIQCVRCGDLAHSKDMPRAHRGYDWSQPRFLTGDPGLLWAEIHRCTKPLDPGTTVRLAAAADAAAGWATIEDHMARRHPRITSAMHFAVEAVACHPGCSKVKAAAANGSTSTAVTACISAGLIAAERRGHAYHLTVTPAALDLIHPGTGRPHRDDPWIRTQSSPQPGPQLFMVLPVTDGQPSDPPRGAW